MLASRRLPCFPPSLCLEALVGGPLRGARRNLPAGIGGLANLILDLELLKIRILCLSRISEPVLR